MLATFRVQHHDDSNTTEFVTFERNSVYHLVMMLELNNNVKAYSIIAEGEPLANPHMTYSFSRNIEMAKYTTQPFEW